MPTPDPIVASFAANGGAVVCLLETTYSHGSFDRQTISATGWGQFLYLCSHLILGDDCETDGANGYAPVFTVELYFKEPQPYHFWRTRVYLYCEDGVRQAVYDEPGYGWQKVTVSPGLVVVERTETVAPDYDLGYYYPDHATVTRTQRLTITPGNPATPRRSPAWPHYAAIDAESFEEGATRLVNRQLDPLYPHYYRGVHYIPTSVTLEQSHVARSINSPPPPASGRSPGLANNTYRWPVGAFNFTGESTAECGESPDPFFTHDDADPSFVVKTQCFLQKHFATSPTLRFSLVFFASVGGGLIESTFVYHCSEQFDATLGDVAPGGLYRFAYFNFGSGGSGDYAALGAAGITSAPAEITVDTFGT